MRTRRRTRRKTRRRIRKKILRMISPRIRRRIRRKIRKVRNLRKMVKRRQSKKIPSFQPRLRAKLCVLFLALRASLIASIASVPGSLLEVIVFLNMWFLRMSPIT